MTADIQFRQYLWLFMVDRARDVLVQHYYDIFLLKRTSYSMNNISRRQMALLDVSSFKSILTIRVKFK